MYTALTIAGSDPSGGAGIQADIKTMTAHGVYAMSAVTALTAQNTTGVYDIMEVTAPFLAGQLDCIFTDIFPDAVKIGMTSSPELIDVIADKLEEYRAVHIVLDPVMVSTSSARLIGELITPNIPEAQVLTGRGIITAEDMERAAKSMQERFGCNVLVKGGHQTNTANDVLCLNGQLLWFCGQHINNPNTHGTGCTLSSAIASNLAMGQSLSKAVQNAKDYLSGALADMLDLGAGSGPLNHMYQLTK